MDVTKFNTIENISQKTINNYKSSGKKINNGLGKSKLDNIKKVKKIIQQLSNPSKPQGYENRQGNYYSAIVKYLAIDNDNLDLLQKYRTVLHELNNKHKNKAKVLTEEQKNVDYESGKNKFIEHLKSRNLENLSPVEFIFAFYMLLPPRRRDYQNMIFTRNPLIINNPEHNYLFNKGRSYKMLFNNFKTIKSMGQQKFFLSVKTDKMLRNIVKRRNLKEGDFLYNAGVRQLNRDINSITEKYFGSKLNIIDLRVLHNSTKFKNSNVHELKDDAERMGHQVTTKIQNYIRPLK